VRQAEEQYSRNRDAHDVPLDGERVKRIKSRLIQRERSVVGTAYIEEKVEQLIDAWASRRSQNFRLAYEPARSSTENLVGLLERPGHGEWTMLTVADSMRETENEVGLVLPRRSLADAGAQAPPWVFPGTPVEDEEADGDVAMADELGDSWTADGEESE
jgi:hypothetical protein